MNHYRQTLTVNAPPAAVYAALTTADGLRGWWTEDCDVATQAGGTLRFRFGECRKEMRIERLEPEGQVHWHCTGAHIAAAGIARDDEWVGTELVFRLAPDGHGGTRLDFEHVGLVPSLECYSVCSRGWQHYLASLQQYVETGRGTPFERAAAVAA